MKPRIFALLMIIANSIPAIAQQFTLSGEIRPRMELRHGYRTLPDENSDMAAFVNQRSRLNLLYESKLFNAYIGFQDVRLWGGKGMFDVQPGAGIHQAFVEIPFNEKLSAKFGRQEIKLNNQRLFGRNNWNQAGRTHDAAVFSFSDNGWNVKLATSFNQTIEENFGTFYFGDEYKTLNFIWFEKKLNNFDISALAVADGFQRQHEILNNTYFRFTYGGIINWKFRENSLEMHAYYQSGNTNEGQQIAALYLSPIARLKLSERLDMHVGAELFTGNNLTKNDNKYRVFVPLYGAAHAFNGHLDYFTNIPRDTKNAGLTNLFLNFIYKLNDRVSLLADYHYFAAQQSTLPDEIEIEKYLGSEIDLGVQIVFSEELDLEFGYSTMFATESMEVLKGGSSKEPVHWGWAMLTVKPVFFTSMFDK